jgi:hypothetical protein
MAYDLRDSMAKNNLTLPWFNEPETTIIREYVDLVFRPLNQQIGQRYGLDFAEEFHYIGPGENTTKFSQSYIQKYLKDNALPIE